MQKLQKVRRQLIEEEIKKSGKNTFQHFDYYELSDFLPATTRLLEQEGLFSKFNFFDGKATLEIIDCETKEFVVFEIPAPKMPILDNISNTSKYMQSIGGINTYLKRYLYLNALDIAHNDEINGLNQNQKTNTQKNTQIKKFNLTKTDLVKNIKSQFNTTKLNDFLKNNGKSQLEDFTKEELEQIWTMLLKQLQKI